MPKENIYCEENRGESPDESWRAEVQWNTGSGNDDGFVMVGTVNPKSEFHWGMLVGEPRVVAKESDDGKTGEQVKHATMDGYFVHLDRKGINRMIQALRRARDQAYGADA